MRQYELALVLKSDLSQPSQKKLLDAVKSMLKGLKVGKEESMGQKSLAYPLKKQSLGAYYVLEFEGETVPSDLEKKLRTEEGVLRHLLIRTK